MRLDLHVHSNHSDGRDDVEDILLAASRRGLDGIALTDHDTMKGSYEALRAAKRFDLLIIPGAEITTSEGHLLVLGVDMLPAPGRSPEETVETVHEMGGMTVVPHPYHFFRHAIGRIPPVDAVEVYNSRYVLGLSNARARRVADKMGLPTVAGSDSHQVETVGLGVTEVDAGDLDGVLEAIRAGKTRIIGKRTPPSVLAGHMSRWARRRVGGIF